MLPPLVVLWLATPPAPAEPQRAVARWAAERGFRAEPVPTTADPPYAEQAVLEIEGLLEETRSLTPGAAQLERLDQLLLQHPELPQAGWWLAERYALERQQVSGRPESTGAELEQQRAALEGPRSPTAGVADAAAALPPPTPLPLELLGLRPRDQLVLDGEPVSAGVPVAVGRHHAQVLRAQRRVWAGWLELRSAQLRLPEVTAPCTDLDLLGTEDGVDAARPAPGVSCTTWGVARLQGGRVELALCHADRCEPWRAYASSSLSTAPAAGTAEPSERWPAWLTWGALGVGAAASTALVLWQAGAFDRAQPATQFVFTGPSAAAVRF